MADSNGHAITERGKEIEENPGNSFVEITQKDVTEEIAAIGTKEDTKNSNVRTERVEVMAELSEASKTEIIQETPAEKETGTGTIEKGLDLADKGISYPTSML